MKIKFISWNLNRASLIRKKLWQFLNDLDFDIGIFQEVYAIPYFIRKNYITIRGEMNAILARKKLFKLIQEKIFFNENEDAIEDFYLAGNVIFNKNKMLLISIYNHFGESDKEFNYFLQSLLKYLEFKKDKPIIIGGDFNMSEKFGGTLKNLAVEIKKFKDNLKKLNYIEVIEEKFGESGYTFITPNKKNFYQLDYLFLPKKLKFQELINLNYLLINKENRLSDHLPLIINIVI
jgi:exonuclease III